MNTDIFTGFIDFFREASKSFRDGGLFFGGTWDYVRLVIDNFLVTILVYNILRILKETRAWQLLKGVFLILMVSLICVMLNLEMVTFIVTNVITLVATALMIVFQPELRRVLESVGLRSFSSSSISNAIVSDADDAEVYTVKLIDQVVDACIKMGKEYTGALIIFERSAKLGELLRQENAVELDSAVSSTMLQSIFYKGSPLHDGALLIQNGRLSAARCHIPLSDHANLKDGLGTRHRAALGASELGDAVALVVSEERGNISIALGGILYPMKTAEELRTNLMYLFGVTDVKHTLRERIIMRYGRKKKQFEKEEKMNSNPEKNEPDVKNIPVTQQNEQVTEPVTVTVKENFDGNNDKVELMDYEGDELPVSMVTPQQNNKGSEAITVLTNVQTRKAKKTSRLQKVFFLLISLLFSSLLWVYVQVIDNPVVPDKALTIPLKFENFENGDILDEKGLAADYPVSSIEIRISGRKKDLEKVTADDFKAYISFSETTEPGIHVYDVNIVQQRTFYCDIFQRNPENIPVNIYEKG